MYQGTDFVPSLPGIWTCNLSQFSCGNKSALSSSYSKSHSRISLPTSNTGMSWEVTDVKKLVFRTRATFLPASSMTGNTQCIARGISSSRYFYCFIFCLIFTIQNHMWKFQSVMLVKCFYLTLQKTSEQKRWRINSSLNVNSSKLKWKFYNNRKIVLPISML